MMILIKNVRTEPLTYENQAKIIGMILDEEFYNLEELKALLEN